MSTITPAPESPSRAPREETIAEAADRMNRSDLRDAADSHLKWSGRIFALLSFVTFVGMVISGGICIAAGSAADKALALIYFACSIPSLGLSMLLAGIAAWFRSRPHQK